MKNKFVVKIQAVAGEEREEFGREKSFRPFPFDSLQNSTPMLL